MNDSRAAMNLPSVDKLEDWHACLVVDFARRRFERGEENRRMAIISGFCFRLPPLTADKRSNLTRDTWNMR
jgi:hypothetical protein